MTNGMIWWSPGLRIHGTWPPHTTTEASALGQKKKKGRGQQKKSIDSKETAVRGETKNSLLLPPPPQPPGRLTSGQNRLLPKGRHEKREGMKRPSKYRTAPVKQTNPERGIFTKHSVR